MDAQPTKDYLYQGTEGYVKVKRVTHNSQQGALLHYTNPDPRKMHAVDVTGMQEIEEGISSIEQASDLRFLVLHGSYDPIHAGADITQFAGDPDIPAIKAHLDRGTALDSRIKQLWPKLRTIAINCGDRYGGSVEWPQFAEWGIADNATRIQFSEVHLGIVPGWNGVLNILLKSGAENARYMGATGNAVTASQMLEMGLVQQVVDVPPAPDRRAIARDEWPAAWAAHAAACQPLLIKAALDLATQQAQPARISGYTLAQAAEIQAEIMRRTDPTPYAALSNNLKAQLAGLGATPDMDQLKALNKNAIKDLARLGKPLAPAAVHGITDYVTKWSQLSRDELLANYDEAGQEEADLCTLLMSTEHRRLGINAVLSKDPADRIPVFAN